MTIPISLVDATTTHVDLCVCDGTMEDVHVEMFTTKYNIRTIAVQLYNSQVK